MMEIKINSYVKEFLFTIFSVLSCLMVNAQLKHDTCKSVQYLIVPVIYKTPETGFATGISGSISFKTSHKNDSLTRTSIIQGIGFVTSHHQNVEAIDATIYFPKEKYILLTQIAHSYFPDKFWGIGPNTKEDLDPKKKHGEYYVYEQFYINPHIKKKIKKHVFIGLLYEFQNVFNIKYTIGERFDTSFFFGKQNYKVSGAGFSLGYDTRNLTFWPSKGVYIQTLVTGFRKETGSDYDLVKWITDLRWYKKIYKNQIFAMQLYNYVTQGNTPLRELASLGGSNNMRGFYQGRYRDTDMFSLISEYRTPVKGRISACAFAGVGNVYSTFKDLIHSDIKYSYGAGIRYALLTKEKLNIRVDYGYSSRNNKGLYFTIAECF